MIRQAILFIGILLFSIQSFAEEKCFLLVENNKVLKQEGDCDKRYSPASTFKILLSLMGYDAGIFKDEIHPLWQFKKSYDLFLNVCKVAHDPRTWMRDSCVWYSQVLTQKLGMEKFKEYIMKFNYGNQDISGDKGKNNGLTNAWLSSSLEISPHEQTIFIQKLVDNKLDVSMKAYEMTQKIMYKEELSGGWKLYGKTGNGRNHETNLQHGWFVGWIEKNGRKIVFANHIVDDKKKDIFASFRAKNAAQNRLWKLIDELEK